MKPINGTVTFSKAFKEMPNYRVYENGDVLSLKYNKVLKWVVDGDGYLMTSIRVNGKNKSVRQHQLVYKYHNDDYPLFKTKLVINHKDTNKQNNSPDNLELITNRKNSSLERTVKSNLPTGVTFHKASNKYNVGIWLNGKKYHLGLFVNVDSAKNAYESALQEFETGGLLPKNKISYVSFDTTNNTWTVRTKEKRRKHFKTEAEAITFKNKEYENN